MKKQVKSKKPAKKTEPKSTKENKKIPEGIWIISIIMFAGAFFSFMFAGFAFQFVDIGQELLMQFGVNASMLVWLGILLLIMSIFSYLIARGLLKAQRWAWAVVVILFGLTIISAIINIFQGIIATALYIIVIYGIALWYLLRKQTQKFYN